MRLSGRSASLSSSTLSCRGHHAQRGGRSASWSRVGRDERRDIDAVAIDPHLDRPRVVRVQRPRADGLVGGVDFREVPTAVVGKNNPRRRTPAGQARRIALPAAVMRGHEHFAVLGCRASSLGQCRATPSRRAAGPDGRDDRRPTPGRRRWCSPKCRGRKGATPRSCSRRLRRSDCPCEGNATARDAA